VKSERIANREGDAPAESSAQSRDRWSRSGERLGRSLVSRPSPKEKAFAKTKKSEPDRDEHVSGSDF